MLLSLLAVATLVLLAVVGEIPHPLPAGRHLAHRNLDSCIEIRPAFENILETIYVVSFDCSCTSNMVSCTSKRVCCGDFCGVINQSAAYSSSGYPISETSCLTYDSDEVGLLNGKTRCFDFDYCSSGTSICGCDARIDSSFCNNCSICRDFPFYLPEGAEIAVTDCNNIPGGELTSYQCSDIDTWEELERIANRHCKEDDDSGLSTGAIVGIVAAVLAGIVLIVGVAVWLCKMKQAPNVPSKQNLQVQHVVKKTVVSPTQGALAYEA